MCVCVCNIEIVIKAYNWELKYKVVKWIVLKEGNDVVDRGVLRGIILETLLFMAKVKAKDQKIIVFFLNEFINY